MILKKIIPTILFLFLIQTVAFGQFGKNKVQYKYFDWYYIQTKHFDIYFTNGGETLAEFAGQVSEESLKSIQNSFNYTINNRVSIIVYNSQNDFQETNITSSDLSEGIEGFTELFKNRVVVQFHGGYPQFEHLIHHELVHAVMNDMFYGGSIQNIIANNITIQIPTWFNEGMAEYQALGWDIDTDMFLRDASINEYLPDVQNLSGYFAYRGGQAVFYYIAKKYGEQKVGEIVNSLRSTGNVNDAFKQTLGLTLKEFNERWKKDIKRVYWPDIEITQDPDEFAKRLTDPEDDDGFYNTSPAISPQGDKIAFITNRDYFFSLYLMDANTGKVIKKLLEGNSSPNFEELNILTPGLTWSPDGKKLAFAALSHGYDVLYIIDVESEDYYTLPIKLDAIHSVSWSWDSKQLAFIGQTSRESDIYIYNFETNEYRDLTDDLFIEKDPCWSHDGKFIYYSSDKNIKVNQENSLSAKFEAYRMNSSQTEIFAYNVENGVITQITNMPNSNETSPVLSEDDKQLLFISDLNGINNIYKKNLVFNESDENISEVKDIEPVPITNSQSGLYQLSISKDSKKLAFSSLYESSFNIFVLSNPFEIDLGLKKLPLTKYRKGMLDIDIRPNEIVKHNQGNGNNIFDEDSTDSSNVVYFTKSEKDSSRSYGDSVQIDFGNYVFGEDKIANNETGKEKEREKDLFNPTNNLDENGNYKVHQYKINFAPDLVYANAGYSTLYGFVGTTLISFSDVLGNHQLIGITGLQIDLKNSDYGLAYYYLGQRTNLGIQGFHTARFVRLARRTETGQLVGDLFRFRNFGLVGSASYPLNRFYRLDFGFSVLNVKSENLDNIAEPTEDVFFYVPSIGFVHDNVLWGYTAPIEGTRYRFDVFGNVGITQTNQRFISFTGDYRTYFRFFTDHSFAMRFSGGVSEGPRPQRFFIGGIENWINRSFATTEIPIESAADYAFLTAALPLRGYNYSEQIGTKYFLTNFELRFPLIRYLLTGGIPLLFNNIIGTVFFDAGTAWTNNSNLRLFKKNSNGNLVSDDLLMGTGVGARLYFLYFLLRFDVAWPYNIDGFKKPKFYFSLGADF